ncbi:MAG TPA: sigma-70 family RNA polymerase sigma factor [Candidatus Baltobacteraceae bacterium]|jgi:RNA polymerase sigma-70 factor (ECF subfamily)|nr:sigma-70 family RNA polymerase sigma factor [Candidatus Baltobacteraceae bacterium]
MHQAIEQPFFETLFAAEYRGVLAVAQRMVGSAAAEDVAQETFAALLRAGPSDPVHARNWLYRVVVHRALDLLKRDQERRRREARAPMGASPPGPDELIEQRETREAVHRVLLHLKSRDAGVLSLRYGGLSYKEISQVMNVPVQRVGVLLTRAEAAFKKELNRVSSR